jgi:hypothetical protein
VNVTAVHIELSYWYFSNIPEALKITSLKIADPKRKRKKIIPLKFCKMKLREIMMIDRIAGERKERNTMILMGFVKYSWKGLFVVVVCVGTPPENLLDDNLL